MYNLIWREFFRDQNLQNSPVVDTGDGPDTLSNYVLLKRGKRHDYFTSCQVSAQRGSPVNIGLTGSAPVKGIGSSDQSFPATNYTAYESGGTSRQYAYARNSTVHAIWMEGTASTIRRRKCMRPV